MNKSNNTISTIFFDVGGVLSVDFIEIKVNDLANKYKMDYELLLEAKKKFRPLADLGQISDRDFWVQMLKDVGIDATEEDCDIDTYVREIDSVLDIARNLKQHGYHIAILSNDSLELAIKRRTKFGYDHLFQEVVLSCELGMVKPEPEIYQYALKRLNTSANRSILIDDRLENTRGAERLGMQTILFKDVEQTKKELAGYGVNT